MHKTSPHPYYEHARDVAVEAAMQAAHLIRMQAGRLHETDVQEKGIHDLVTHVDEASQALIIDCLGRHFPEHDVLAEEGAAGLVPVEAADGYRWIIDPIDGTTNFTRGLSPYAVSIALQHGLEVVVGVVLEVMHEELFTAVRGGGAYRNGVRIHVSGQDKLDRSLLATGFPYRAYSHMDRYITVFSRFMRETRGVRRFGSASVDLAYVACGRFDGFYETGLQAWDVAAGILLVEEAGGRVTDYDKGLNPLFTEQILASNGLVHEAMLTVLQSMQVVRD